MERLRVGDRVRGGAWIGQGAIAGLLAGAAFLAFELAVAAVTMGAGWALHPLRMMAGILVGPGALDPASPVLPVSIAGLVVHATLSAAFGALFAAALSTRPEHAPPRTTGTMLAAAAAYGLALWLVNFYVIAPLAGWQWFPRETNPIVQFVAHTAVYGLFVGSYLDRVDARRRAISSPEARDLVRIIRRRRPAA